MRVRLEPATLEHFPAVLERLLRPLNPAVTGPVWRRLFEQPWAPRDALRGQVLLDGDIPVGYVAFLQADVPFLGGRRERVCNVSTWVVDPAYGQRAPSLIAPILRMSDATVTNLTPVASVHEMFTRLGFQELETSGRVLLPAPLARSTWGFTEVESSLDAILPSLSGHERAVAEAHRGLCHHLLVRESGGRHCYVMFSLGRLRRLPSARLYWVTPGALGEGSLALRRALFDHFGVVFTEMDARLAPGGLPACVDVPLKVPRLFRSSRVRPEELSNAFSELVLLGL